MKFSFVNLGGQAQSAAQRVRAANPFARAPRSAFGRVIYGVLAILLAIPVALLIVALLLCGLACVIVVVALFIAFALVRMLLRILTPSAHRTRDLSRPDDAGRENVRVRGSSNDAP